MLQEGDKAPDFSAYDDTGNLVTLKGLRGKKVVLYFYPKDNTPGCTKEACDFRDNLARVTKHGAVVLGVSPDQEKAHKKFKDKFELNFPLLIDDEKKIIEAYGVWKPKLLYGKKFMGVVRSTFVIDGAGKIAKIFPKVSVAGHADAIIDVLEHM